MNQPDPFPHDYNTGYNESGYTTTPRHPNARRLVALAIAAAAIAFAVTIKVFGS